MCNYQTMYNAETRSVVNLITMIGFSNTHNYQVYYQNLHIQLRNT